MLKDSTATKPKKPPRGKNNTETRDDEFSSTSSTFSSSSSSLLSSPCPSRKDVGKKNKRKRSSIQSSPEKERENQRRRPLIPKPISASIPSSTFSPKQHLQMALYNLNQAYIGLKEGEEKKEQVKLLGDYIQSTLAGENPFIKEKERKERDVLKGLVEEVKALRKEVAPETYAEKLKKGLAASSFAPPCSTTTASSPPISLSSPPSSLSPPTSKTTSSTTSSTSPTSSRGKKKQL